MTHPNGWEAVTSGPTGRHCLDRRVEYWRKRLPDGTFLTVRGVAWAHRGLAGTPNGARIRVLASGTSGTLSAAKKAAEAAARNTNTKRTP